MTIKPLLDRVVTKFVEAEETTKSGIILTPAAKEKPQIAEIVAVGPGGIVDGEKQEMYVKVGDRVLLNKYAGTEVKVDGVEYQIIRQSDILAIVEQEKSVMAKEIIFSERARKGLNAGVDKLNSGFSCLFVALCRSFQ